MGWDGLQVELRQYAKALVRDSQTLAHTSARSLARNKRELFESLRKELEYVGRATRSWHELEYELA